MAAEIKLTKGDESPWGFRLTGGRDFGTPLTIIKVAANSVAEQAGLKVGDILMRINNEPGQTLTHRGAQDIIKKSGNSITFSVLRGNLSLPEEVIERLTPLPLQEFVTQTPEPHLQECEQGTPAARSHLPIVDPRIEIIPIKDLEPEQLQELGLNPLPEDFLEKALRDPSPLPEVRPHQTCATPIPDVLDTLEQLGLQDVVEDIERQKEIVPPEPIAEVSQPAAKPQQTQEESGVPKQGQPTQVQIPPETALQEQPQLPPLETENLVKPTPEEEFAEIMSGKAEVIEGTQAIGVDFKKYEPQTEFLKKSQVFQTLQEEEQQNNAKKETEKEKRWTTFLEKPDRPKPKPKPKPAKTQGKSEPAKGDEETAPTPTPTPEPGRGLYDIPSQEEFEALVQVPEPAPVPAVQPEEENPAEDQPLEEQSNEEVAETLQAEPNLEEQQLLQQQRDLEQQLSPELTVEEKSDIELQLEEIQKQLEAIQQLPFEIQQHLSLVQDQLTKIVQHRNQEQTEKSLPVPPAAPRPSIAEEAPKQEEPTEDATEESIQEVPEQTEEQPSEQLPEEEKTNSETKPEDEQPLPNFEAEGEEQMLPPPKIEKVKKKRPFMGLGPAPRPLILPGGRKWRTPKDAYNEEFIAETLSAQAEIITGTTLGVNFRKYEPKRPGLAHLRDSNVYKMIHDLEDPSVIPRGLADRPEFVPALQDYVQSQAPPAAI